MKVSRTLRRSRGSQHSSGRRPWKTCGGTRTGSPIDAIAVHRVAAAGSLLSSPGSPFGLCERGGVIQQTRETCARRARLRSMPLIAEYGVATSYIYHLGALPSQGRVELGVVEINGFQHPSRVYPRLFARTYAPRAGFYPSGARMMHVRVVSDICRGCTHRTQRRNPKYEESKNDFPHERRARKALRD